MIYDNVMRDGVMANSNEMKPIKYWKSVKKMMMILIINDNINDNDMGNDDNINGNGNQQSGNDQWWPPNGINVKSLNNDTHENDKCQTIDIKYIKY